MRKNKLKTPIVVVVFILLTACFIIGEVKYSQADTQTTQTTTTTTEDNGNKSTTVTTEKHQTESRPEKKEEGHSLLGGFFGFLGDVIAFPFRLIGNVFDAIF